MKKLLFLSFLLINIQLTANDGVFYAEGGQLIPIKENSIEMRKEILELKREGEWMQVDVYFEFYNPGDNRELLVGFVTPPASGDTGEDEMTHPQVRDFSVEVNGAKLRFDIARLKDSEFKLSEKDFNGFDFVYYFKMPFKAGKTIVKHRYWFRGGSSVEMEADYAYRLTTARGWAGGSIKDFTLKIDMGEKARFAIPESFFKNGEFPKWKIKGKGRIASRAHSFYENKERMVYIEKGSLICKIKNFKPDFDLMLIIYHPINEVVFWNNDDPKRFNFEAYLYLSGYHELADLQELKDEELRYLRNYLFAKEGYVFKNKELRKYFENCFWYIPKKGVDAISKMTEKEQKLLKEIQGVEAERKKLASEKSFQQK